MTTFRNEGMSGREEVDFRVLRALSADPDISQRQLAKTAGVSLGAVNYCLRALAEKGLVKVNNFRASDNKLRYAYVLTPSGVNAKGRLTCRFLLLKLQEYSRIRADIREAITELRATAEDTHDAIAFCQETAEPAYNEIPSSNDCAEIDLILEYTSALLYSSKREPK